jgi:phosphoribosylamine---glycine ligase
VNVLLLGSGGRESAMAWALDSAPSVTQLVAAPGNAGISRQAEVVAIDPADPRSVVDLARRMDAHLIVIGPEAPLVAGVGDALRADGRRVFGPNQSAARIEGSKSYAKKLMQQAHIPTARARAFTSPERAIAFVGEIPPPYVIKADGLAAGKGVVVTDDHWEAVEAIRDRMVRGLFGEAGSRIVIEEFLDGEEASLIAFTDGRTVVACEPAQDYKRAYDHDLGPNTGGMGSYSPVPACPPDVADRIVKEMLEPMVYTTANVGAPFVGALYAGLALTSAGPKVFEFNARFGDPETQAILPRLRSDFGEVCLACASGELDGMRLEWSEDVCVSVVLASGGYPGGHRTGLRIRGLETADFLHNVHVFHAGTQQKDDAVVTSGGRVLAVSALGRDFGRARALAYKAAERIRFQNMYMRSDIALRAERTERLRRTKA